MSKAFDVGSRIGKYQITGILGAGGMGVVYEAQHLELKKKVAIKTLHPEYAQVPVAQARFVREGEAASRIRHPHVVDVTDLGDHEGVPYLVMEFLEGMDLSAYLTAKPTLELEETLDLILPVVAAIAAGHDEGVIHRDLKPHNIFLAHTRHVDRHPMVLDFGVSKVAEPATGESNLTATSAMMGTVAYMSPEQAMGAKMVDGRSDQYSLALIIYECMTGRRAHEGDNTLAVLRQIGDGAIEPPSTHVAGLPPAFEEVLMKALSLDPRGRYDSMYAFGRALLPFASARAAAQWQGPFQREPEPNSLPPVDFDRPAPSTRARTMRQGSGPTPAAKPAPAPASASASDEPGSASSERPKPEPKSGSGEARPAPQFAKTMPLPQAIANPVKTTLGQSATELPAVAPAPRSRRPIFAIAGGAVAAVVLVAVLSSRKPPPKPVVSAPPPVAAVPAPAPPRTFHVVVTVHPESAQLELDGLPAGTGKLDRELTADGREHTLKASAPDFTTRTVTFVDAPPPPTLDLPPANVAPPETAATKPTRPHHRATRPTAPAKVTPSVGANQAPILKE